MSSVVTTLATVKQRSAGRAPGERTSITSCFVLGHPCSTLNFLSADHRHVYERAGTTEQPALRAVCMVRIPSLICNLETPKLK